MTTQATRTDRRNQVIVTLAGVFCVLGTLFGTGVIGTRVAESAGGSLSADATLIAPAGPAFSIWSVIYAGLFAYTIWQWLPGAATRRRVRETRLLAAASMVLNASWLLVTQVDALVGSVAVIVALVVCLGALVARLTRSAPQDVVESVILDGTFGLYLGWVCVATCANIAATLVAYGAPSTGAVATVATLAVLVVIGALSLVLARRLEGRLAVAGAIAWGLAWVAIGRTTDEPFSIVVAVGAVAVAVLAVGAALVERRVPTPTAVG